MHTCVHMVLDFFFKLPCTHKILKAQNKAQIRSKSKVKDFVHILYIFMYIIQLCCCPFQLRWFSTLLLPFSIEILFFPILSVVSPFFRAAPQLQATTPSLPLFFHRPFLRKLILPPTLGLEEKKRKKMLDQGEEVGGLDFVVDFWGQLFVFFSPFSSIRTSMNNVLYFLTTRQQKKKDKTYRRIWVLSAKKQINNKISGDKIWKQFQFQQIWCNTITCPTYY